jgi:methyl-accepting chemotaxis protein WspA
VQDQHDRDALLRFRQQADAFSGQLEQLLDLYGKDREAARRVLLEELIPAWDKGRQMLGEMITLNKQIADTAAAAIVRKVEIAEATMIVSLLLALLIAGICGCA